VETRRARGGDRETSDNLFCKRKRRVTRSWRESGRERDTERGVGGGYGSRENRDKEDRESDEQAGDILQETGRIVEEGARASGSVRCRSGADYILQHWQAV